VGKELPLRQPIESDVFRDSRANCAEKLKLCDERDGIISETDLELCTS